MRRATRDVEEREERPSEPGRGVDPTRPPRGFPLTDCAYALGGRRTFTSPTSTLPRVSGFENRFLHLRANLGRAVNRVIAEINR